MYIPVNSVMHLCLTQKTSLTQEQAGQVLMMRSKALLNTFLTQTEAVLKSFAATAAVTWDTSSKVNA
mgnify:CR=1 FL=1